MEGILISDARRPPDACFDSIIFHRGSHGHDESKWLHAIVGRGSERFLLFRQTVENFPPIRKYINFAQEFAI
jgi:hypothetical protein